MLLFDWPTHARLDSTKTFRHEVSGTILCLLCSRNTIETRAPDTTRGARRIPNKSDPQSSLATSDVQTSVYDKPSTEEQVLLSLRPTKTVNTAFHLLTTVKPEYQNPVTSDEERGPLDVVEEAYSVVLYILVIQSPLKYMSSV